jgi:glycosyltransferase involved in cell wall biosynthesis
MRWIVSQIGRREEYAVARGFARDDRLLRLYTDVWVGRGRRLLARGPRAIRDLRNRYHPEIPAAAVRAFNFRLIAMEAMWRRGHKGHDFTALTEYYLRQGKYFDGLVAARIRRLPRQEKLGVFAFTSAALQTLGVARDRGDIAVHDQIDPSEIEHRIVAEEAAAWPGWEPTLRPPAQEYVQHIRREWDVASVVLVNSGFSKSALIEQGVPAEKIIVVPLAYELPRSFKLPIRTEHPHLVVLWLGSVILRKGIQYLRDAARLLVDEAVEFRIVGPNHLSSEAVATFPPNVKFLGKISGSEKIATYAAADVFVLPTLSDGFAITQIEAMCHGLPVIATPNCGEVVTDGRDGFVVPIRDPVSLADRIQRLCRDRRLLRDMSGAALEKSGKFTLAHYIPNLESELGRVGRLA